MTHSQETTTQTNKSSFGKDVLKLVSGTAVAQALSILAAPILTRLYAPEAFGVVALFVSITSIINVIACMRYELAIMLPESDEEAANLLGVSLSFVVLISCLTVPLVWFGKSFILDIFNASELAAYLWLIPPMVFFSGAFLALNYWNSRTKKFGRLSIARIIQSFGTTGIQLGAALIGYKTGGSLVAAYVVGTATSTLILGGQIWRDDHQLLRNSIHLQEMIYGIKRYYKFPLYNTWAAFLNNLSWQLPTLMLSAFFSPIIAGYYDLGNRVLKIPMSLIGNSISQVFFQRASEAKTSNYLDVVVEKTFFYLIKLCLFPSLVLTLMGKELFEIIFGSQWSEAGIYVQILGIWTLIWFVSSPLSNLLSVLEKQEFALFINVFIFITRLISLYVGGVANNIYLAIALFSFSGIFAYGYLVVMVMKFAGVSLIQTSKLFCIQFLYTLPFVLPIFAAREAETSRLIILLFSTIFLLFYEFVHNRK
ncbi:lipopolysaccharide biosynthesis protein [Picosynechococcus sp. PCC 11901]|uniref:oligosaccharide flippase family protein n=1 Tax=Picosynechococcus sp. PCC 11901 TaxID=2579791 RepID=UPI0010FC3124|nr:oligosaccharide flippase family protein [Picosynechococcus sp. PCC 11901]QCS49051.1 lipopolysaccharide biosynthesis protein [Picosynechococcus sp. PCC 11901]